MTTPPPGVVNFRDAGGHATPDGVMATGRLFRSANLMNLADPHGLAPYGIATVVDLRNDEERLDHPTRLHPAMTIVDITIDPGSWRQPGQGLPRLDDLYAEMVEHWAGRLVEAVDAVARHSAEPLLVHCTGGKDRTGMVIALIQGLLGVADDVIAAHYAESGEHLLAAWLASPPPNVTGGTDWQEFVDSGLLASPPEIMFDVLGRLRREHDSVEGFLAAHALDPLAVTRLRTHLICIAA